MQEQLILNLRNELRIIKPILSRDLPATDDFRKDLNLDSLDLVEFIARMEQNYNIMIPDEDLPQFISLQTSAKYIQSKLENL